MINKIKEFNENKLKHKEPMPVYARLLDIQSEIGELAKEYLKHSSYGTSEFELNDDFILEYGDVLYSFLSLADELNIDSKFALDKVINKYKARIEKHGSMGSEKTITK